jgi:outer membrane murein-binding lipoprotein Lpp
MFKRSFALLRVPALLAVGGLGLSACATQEYVDHRIAEVNEHIGAVEGKTNEAEQKADAAMSAAQAAQALAVQANQKVDQLSIRVDTLQQQPAPPPPRTPRG